MNSAFLGTGAVGAALAVAAVLAPTSKPGIAGCGTTAIAKADLSNVAALKAGAECFATAEALGRAAKQVRLDRIAALAPAPGGTMKDTALREFKAAATEYVRRFNAGELTPAQVDAGHVADRPALAATLAVEHACSAREDGDCPALAAAAHEANAKYAAAVR